MTRNREKALDELLDRQEITDCLVRYMRGIDRHDMDLVASAYHPGALDDHTMYVGPGTEFGPVVNAFHDERWCAHQHVLSNISFEFDGDTAHVESYWIACGVRNDRKGVDIAGGRYIDRFARRGGRWAIAARVCSYTWGLNPEEMAVALGMFPTGRQDRSDLSYTRPLDVDLDRLKSLHAVKL